MIIHLEKMNNEWISKSVNKETTGQSTHRLKDDRKAVFHIPQCLTLRAESEVLTPQIPKFAVKHNPEQVHLFLVLTTHLPKIYLNLVSSP